MSQLDSAGIRPLASAKRLQKEAYRAWFTGLMFSTVAGLYALWQIRQREQNIDKSNGEGVVESKKLIRSALSLRTTAPVILKLAFRERTVIDFQLISDLCDLTIPSTALGYTNLDDGLVGLAGTLSSLIGVWSAWKKTA